MAKSSKTLTLDDVNAFVERLRATIQAAAETEAIKAAIAGLTGQSFAAPKGKPGRKPKAVAAKKVAKAAKAAPKAGKKARRTRKPGIKPEDALAVLSDKPQKIGDVAKKMKESAVPRVRAALLKLRDMKKAKMSGTKANAVWTKA